MSNMVEYNGLCAFHPGYYVAEFIDDMGISQTEFAQRTGMTEETAGRLVSGKCRLSDDMAQSLSAMTGTSAEVWLNLQREFDKKVFEIEQQKEFKAQKPAAQIVDYAFSY